jgi:hypothetical protein
MLLTGYRTSVSGRAMVSFSWTASSRAHSDLVVADFADRWDLANWVLSAAKQLSLVIKDGRPRDGGLEYVTDVEHLLENGSLPLWLNEMEITRAPGLDDRNMRFAAYSRLSHQANRELVFDSQHCGVGCGITAG